MPAIVLDGEEFLPEQEYANQRNIKRSTVAAYRNHTTNGMPYLFLGKTIHIPVNKADAWLKEHKLRHNNRSSRMIDAQRRGSE
jgi:hypothetical protein